MLRFTRQKCGNGQSQLLCKMRERVDHLLDSLSRRMEITVGLVGLLCIVFRAQAMSEKLKTVLSKSIKKVGRGHKDEPFTVDNGTCCSATCTYRRHTSVTRSASHLVLKCNSAAEDAHHWHT